MAQEIETLFHRQLYVCAVKGMVGLSSK